MYIRMQTVSQFQQLKISVFFYSYEWEFMLLINFLLQKLSLATYSKVPRMTNKYDNIQKVYCIIDLWIAFYLSWSFTLYSRICIKGLFFYISKNSCWMNIFKWWRIMNDRKKQTFICLKLHNNFYSGLQNLIAQYDCWLVNHFI